ncbi:hypothetical protein FM120_26405 [Sphingobacterium faecium PCAi_F2.5]|nr:hypothetical protein FM120_26405 [Sphingobacterium faecium PCAi_F2.5]
MHTLNFNFVQNYLFLGRITNGNFVLLKEKRMLIFGFALNGLID